MQLITLPKPRQPAALDNNCSTCLCTSWKAYLAKVADHFLYERPHRCNVDDLELFRVDGSVLVDVFADLAQHCQQCDVRLTSSLHTTRA